MPSVREKRPVRSAKAQPAPGYVDSSTLLFDSEDEGTASDGDRDSDDQGSNESDDEDRHVAKKPRLERKLTSPVKKESPPAPPPPPAAPRQ